MSAPLTETDLLPHEQAVWRPYANDGQHAWFPPPGANDRKVSIEHPDGRIIQTWAHLGDWTEVVRWRFGWAPRP